ncbi:MAG TPA: hypothetical protein VMK32_07470 [Burkholderiaceae bacterium]|nr:hypothetical protein [Burkholderiaceae bacterium]
MELFLFARFHARPGCQAALRNAITTVEGATPAASITGPAGSSAPRAKSLHSRWCDRAALELQATLPRTVQFLSCTEALIAQVLSVSPTEPVT